MGKIRDTNKQDSHTLTEREWNILLTQNLVLQYSILKDKAFSQLLYYFCTQRLGYTETDNLIFELDLQDESRELKVRSVPTEAVEKAKQNLRQDLPG